MPVNDEIREQRSKLKGKSFKYKFSYFWEYYRWATLGTIVGIIFVIALVKSIVTSKATAFQAIFINSQCSISTEEFSELIGINTSKEEVLFEANYTLNLDPDSYDESSYVNMQKIVAMTQAGQLDVVFGYEDSTEYFGRNELFYDLREIFGEQFITDLGDKVLWVDVLSTDDDGNDIVYKAPVAINVSDAPFIVSNGCYPYGDCYFAVVGNTSHIDWVKLFYEYIYK